MTSFQILEAEAAIPVVPRLCMTSPVAAARTEIGPGFRVKAFATGQHTEEDGCGISTVRAADVEPAFSAHDRALAEIARPGCCLS